MVRFRKVALRYGHGPEVLSDISFHLEAGSFHFLTGPSGAGKTSLLSLVYLARRPSRGKITIFGRDVTTMARHELPPLRRRIGVVFQDFRLLNHLTALDNVALPLRIAGAKRQEIEAHVTELLAWVGLGDQIAARPPTMSDGEKQRAAIARAVINRPNLLLADEPTGNVDPERGLKILHLFEELNKIGMTIVIATHDRSLVDRFAYPELRIIDGRLEKSSPLERPAGRPVLGPVSGRGS